MIFFSVNVTKMLDHLSISHKGIPCDTHKHSFSMSQLLPIFCEPQNSDKPVGIRLSTTKDGFSSGS